MTSPIDPKLLEILICPMSRGTLTLSADGTELLSEKAKLAYPIRDGVPVMLKEEARVLEDEDL